LTVPLRSLKAVVDHDGDRTDGDGDHRHPDQDGPNASKPNGARHEAIWKEGLRVVKLASALTLPAKWNAPPDRHFGRLSDFYRARGLPS
jgi:hypothetical protein